MEYSVMMIMFCIYSVPYGSYIGHWTLEMWLMQLRNWIFNLLIFLFLKLYQNIDFFLVYSSISFVCLFLGLVNFNTCIDSFNYPHNQDSTVPSLTSLQNDSSLNANITISFPCLTFPWLSITYRINYRLLLAYKRPHNKAVA